MKDLVPYLQNISALAFMLLGVVTAVGWARRRDRSLGWLALAIILLAGVSLVGRIQPVFNLRLPLVPQLSLIAFMGCAYALLRFRASLIPLSRRAHFAALGALAVATTGFLVVQTMVG